MALQTSFGRGTDRDCIVLVGHGMPASDFPKDRLGKYFALLGMDGDPGRVGEDPELASIDGDLRAWPRTPENDPYKQSLEAIGVALELTSGRRVLIAYNEFCAPKTEDAITRAVREGAPRVTVISIMLTQGGGHSDQEILDSVERARAANPDAEIVYAWPYNDALIAGALAAQVEAFAPTVH